MFDYLWQRMEGSRGDLADIVQSGSRGGPAPPSPAPASAGLDPAPAHSAGWQQLLPPPQPAEPARNPTAAHEFCDGGAGERGMAGFVRPCSDELLRVLQISPEGGGSSPSQQTPRPSPAAADCGAVDHGGGVQQISPRSPGIKRRKSQAKKVVCIPAPIAASGRQSTGEVVPSDLWAWRKYGQKPIKGSPYPRGYYRCSSSKGCLARKQVERSRTDPNMLVITYTSEHNHPWPTQRNSLAGSTRSHALSKNSCSAGAQTKTASPAAAAAAAAAAEEEEEEEEEEVASASTQKKDRIIEQAEEQLDRIMHCRPPTTTLVTPDHDFFAELAELEAADPVSLIFSRPEGGELGGGLRKSPAPAVDPFAVFDWGSTSG